MRRRRELDRRKHSKSPYDAPPNDPVIGYVCRQAMQMVCDDDACIVAGTPEAMVAILQYHRRNPAEHTIEPARCSHILQAIALGGAYALDEQAYGRFLPEAQRAGLPLVEEDFSDPGPSLGMNCLPGIHLVRIGFL